MIHRDFLTGRIGTLDLGVRFCGTEIHDPSLLDSLVEAREMMDRQDLQPEKPPPAKFDRREALRAAVGPRRARW